MVAQEKDQGATHGLTCQEESKGQSLIRTGQWSEHGLCRPSQG